MACDICGRIIGHDPRCPKYSPRKVTHYCSSCGEEICIGEEYIENCTGDFKHFDCIYGIRDLIEWFGYDVKIMEDENE